MLNFRPQRQRTARPARTSSSGSNYRRLVLLVATLGLVIFMMRYAGNPNTWRLLFPPDPQPAGPPGSQPTRAKGRDYETRVRPTNADTLPADGFIARAPRLAADGDGDRDGDFFPGVRRDYLTTIEDHTVFRGAERDAWHNLLAVLEHTGEQALREASIGPIGFVQLFEQPAQYRGRLVTVRGAAKQATYKRAKDNPMGIAGYHRIVVRPEGGPASPIIIYALHLPDGFPTGERIHEDVDVTGFFFKNWAYPSNHPDPKLRTILSAPLLLARGVGWEQPVVEPREPISRGQIVLAVLVAAAFGVTVAILVRRSSKLRPRRSGPAARFERPSAEALKHVDLVPDVKESLRKLAESEDDHR